jgi:hypothetical protein
MFASGELPDLAPPFVPGVLNSVRLHFLSPDLRRQTMIHMLHMYPPRLPHHRHGMIGTTDTYHPTPHRFMDSAIHNRVDGSSGAGRSQIRTKSDTGQVRSPRNCRRAPASRFPDQTLPRAALSALKLPAASYRLLAFPRPSISTTPPLAFYDATMTESVPRPGTAETSSGLITGPFPNNLPVSRTLQTAPPKPNQTEKDRNACNDQNR